jgi:hypothetical protein
MVKASDYNCYYPSTMQFRLLGNTIDWAAWQIGGMDPHGLTNNPALSGNAPTVALNGISMLAYFTTDFSGAARPTSGPWTMGAFETITNSYQIRARVRY